ncbi:hypothetical protein [Devosia salina]|uniref:Uncharacterized protein n=1 Tax=Devosia salina TaxID=2860336 RepID=A0ABX8WH84_9HYPH|nr:hypothetical protein [Devosia salina]QYO77748.1 hypothetical protein K1X15_04040 [Devosia salina]
MKLRDSGAGRRLQRESELASRLGVSRATLRHYRDAYVLTNHLPLDLAMRLRREASAVASAALSRWFLEDPDAVLAFLHQREEITDAVVRSALGVRTTKRSAPAKQTLTLEQCLQRLSEPEGSLVTADPRSVFSMASWRWRREAVRFVGVDPAVAAFYGIRHEAVLEEPMEAAAMPQLSWRKIGQKGETAGAWAGLIEVPSMVMPERYAAEARGIWTRAVAASAHYRVVIIVSPNAGARRQLLSVIPPTAASAWLGHPADPERLSGQRKGTSVPIVAGATAGLGLILFSTPFSLLQDLTMPPGPRWRVPQGRKAGSKGRKKRSRSTREVEGEERLWSDGQRWAGEFTGLY